ncbi:hypothetical protein BaRGS_00017045 [Batillaria attramentaria]|uniref:B box-type domain-containing protein n=1 Tax=Batillaria attramentaria TaxID=370345 RepID=A0ABD0KX14_9CAEN
MELLKCSAHSDQPLKFYCTVCNITVCPQCKLDSHQGHATVEKITRAERELQTTERELQTCIDTVQWQIREVEKDMSIFEQSVADTQSKLHEILLTLENRHKEALKMIEEAATEGRKQQEELKESLNQKLAKLCEEKQAVVGAVTTQFDQSLLQTDSILKLRGDPALKASPKQGIPNQRMQVILRSNDEFVSRLHATGGCWPFGRPALAQVTRHSPSVAVVPEFHCSVSPGSSVEALHPLNENAVCVVYTEEKESKVLRSVALYELDKTTPVFVQEIHGLGHKPVKMDDVTSLLLSSVVGEKTTSMNVEIDKYMSQSQHVTDKSNRYTLRKTVTGKYVVHDEMKSAEENESFKIHVEHPVTMCANRTGEYFAVIQHQKQRRMSASAMFSPSGKTPSQEYSVALYRRPNPDPIALFLPKVLRFHPSDVCFHVMDDEEMLLVSDEVTNAVFIVDFTEEHVQDGRADNCRELGAGCPWLTAPTSMAVDKFGVLWIGCRGGRVLSAACVESFDDTHENEDSFDDDDVNEESDQSSESGNSDSYDVTAITENDDVCEIVTAELQPKSPTVKPPLPMTKPRQITAAIQRAPPTSTSPSSPPPRKPTEGSCVVMPHTFLPRKGEQHNPALALPEKSETQTSTKTTQDSTKTPLSPPNQTTPPDQSRAQIINHEFSERLAKWRTKSGPSDASAVPSPGRRDAVSGKPSMKTTTSDQALKGTSPGLSVSSGSNPGTNELLQKLAERRKKLEQRSTGSSPAIATDNSKEGGAATRNVQSSWEKRTALLPPKKKKV